VSARAASGFEDRVEFLIGDLFSLELADTSPLGNGFQNIIHMEFSSKMQTGIPILVPDYSAFLPPGRVPFVGVEFHFFSTGCCPRHFDPIHPRDEFIHCQGTEDGRAQRDGDVRRGTAHVGEFFLAVMLTRRSSVRFVHQ